MEAMGFVSLPANLGREGYNPSFRVALGPVLAASAHVFLRGIVPFLTLAFLVRLLDLPQSDGAAGFVLMLVQAAGGAALYGAVSRTVVQMLEGRAVSTREALRSAFGRLLGVWVTAILFGALQLIGYLLLIVPGIVVGLIWYVALPVAAAEGSGGWAALRRSAELTEGIRWRLLVLLVAVNLPLFALGLLASALEELLGLGVAGRALVWLPGAVLLAFDAVLRSAVYRELRRGREAATSAELVADAA
jgi:hypothetical protein